MTAPEQCEVCRRPIYKWSWASGDGYTEKGFLSQVGNTVKWVLQWNRFILLDDIPIALNRLQRLSDRQQTILYRLVKLLFEDDLRGSEIVDYENLP